MDAFLGGIAVAGFAVWLVLLLGRGGFWLARERLDEPPPQDGPWPAVAAIVPARNEGDVIGRSIGSLLRQDYRGPFSVILVDDHSADRTADLARRAAKAEGDPARLAIIASRALPAGWTGKLWALSEGLRHQGETAPDAPFVWFTDADIEHEPDTLSRLVAKARSEDRDLVSLMVLLSNEGFWEKLLIPPFVFFFAMLYPFAWVNDPGRRMAAAAGGSVLLRRAALARAGDLAPIRSEIIDDCALGRLIKDAGAPQGGSLWLGLTRRSRSIRPYEGLNGIWSMVARSAYAQLGNSPLLLAGTLAGMAVVYAAPPLLLLTWPWHGHGLTAALGAGAWLMMAVALAPMLRHYRQSPAWGALLPAVGVLYAAMTLHSAFRHRRGRGGLWKGRVQAPDASSAGRP